MPNQAAKQIAIAIRVAQVTVGRGDRMYPGMYVCDDAIALPACDC